MPMQITITNELNPASSGPMLHSRHMATRLIAFFIALVLSLPAVFSLGLHTASIAGAAAVQELGTAGEFSVSTSVQDHRSDEPSSPAQVEVLLEVPELPLEFHASLAAESAFSRLPPPAVADLVPPYLEGPQRPPRALGLLA
jgi:hypothetical protein